MSTELKGTSSHSLTQFSGGENGLKLQITDPNWVTGSGYIVVTRSEALELANALIDWYQGNRCDEDEPTPPPPEPVKLTPAQKEYMGILFPEHFR